MTVLVRTSTLSDQTSQSCETEEYIHGYRGEREQKITVLAKAGTKSPDQTRQEHLVLQERKI
jgi:hypothetical protein